MHVQADILIKRRTRWHLIAAVALLIFGTMFLIAGFGAAAGVVYRGSQFYGFRTGWSAPGIRLIVAMNLFGTSGIIMLFAGIAARKRGWRKCIAGTLIAAIVVLAGALLHPGAVAI